MTQDVIDGFDLQQNRDSGQLWLDDRRLLWSTVRELEPKICFETGTWKGGGSTFFIASALHVNGGGMLYTVENNPEMFAAAKEAYRTRWRHLYRYVSLNFGDSLDVYRTLLSDVARHLAARGELAPLAGQSLIDFVFLDGHEDRVSAEFALLAPHVRVGGVVMVHDWYTGKRVPALENNREWQLEIYGTGKGSFESGSVGLAKAIRVGGDT